MLRSNKMALTIMFLLSYLFSLPELCAQTTLGTILGRVSDPTGAVVPGVTVTVTNEKTGISRKVLTDNEGFYTVPSLPPAVYTVTAELTGFKRQVRSGIVLRVNETLRLDLTLEVGELAEVVEVSGEVPLLQTSTSTIGNTVENAKIINLPLNGRDFTQLTLLIPGAVPGNNSLRGTVGGTSVSVTGNRSDNNNFTIDGVINSDTFFKNHGIRVSIDAIQEFKIQTNITSAEFGEAAGAQINLATKSGTNEFHGTFFEFIRNNVLDARDFFAPRRPQFRMNQFGGTFGGPVLLPGYNGRNRTFFFLNYEGLRRRRESTILSAVPTPEMLAGNLAFDQAGRPAPPIFDPLTTRVGPDGKLVRDPFPGNIIPQSRIHPIIATYSRIVYPRPNRPGEVLNFINTDPRAQNEDQFTVRIDHKISDKNNLFGRFSFSNIVDRVPTALPTSRARNFGHYRNLAINDTHVFNPTTILDVRYGYHRDNLVDSTFTLEPVVPVLVGLGLRGIPERFRQFPFPLNLNPVGFASPGQGALTSGPQQNHVYMAMLTKIQGKHTIKFGIDFRNQHIFHDGNFSNWRFDNLPTADPQDVARTGQAMASFLLGLPSQAGRILGKSEANMKQGYYHFFLQDDIKLTPKLTLNLGMRYEWTQWFRSVNDPPNSSWFDTEANKDDPDPFKRGAFVWAGVNPITGEPPNTRKTFIDPDFNNFAPRFGLAYLLTSKTTLRLGYAIFYNSNFAWEGNHMRGNWPYAVGQDLTGLNRDFPTNPIQDVFPELDVSKVPPSAQHTANRRNRVPYMQQWNISLQRELARDLVIEANYIGSKGTKLSSFLSMNDAPPGPGEIQPRRRYPKHLGGFSENQHIATSRYHGGTLRVEKRFTRGSAFAVNYAFSRFIDLNSRWGGESPQNIANMKSDLGLSGLHRKHVFSADLIYELPFGPGKRYLSGLGGAAGKLIGGWQLNGIVFLRSGTPFTVLIPTDNANVGSRGLFQRPNLVGDPVLPKSQRTTARWFNTDAFAMPPPFTFGNLGRNTMIGPGFKWFDFAIYKNVSLRENHTVQFRAEFFNIFNNVNFFNPGATLATPAFGRISGSHPARQIQFGLKYIY